MYRYNHGNLYFFSNKKQQQMLFILENILCNLEKSNDMKTSLVITRCSELKMLNHIRFEIFLCNIMFPVSIKFGWHLNEDGVLFGKYEIIV
jgi:hypothetical protein